jgi:uracil-DNA glycosylase
MNVEEKVLRKLIRDDGWWKLMFPYLLQEDLSGVNNITQIFNKIKLAKDFANVFPSADVCFDAFNKCKYNDLKIILLGQDPYYTKGLANGLAFSSGKPNFIPESLKNIFKELYDDVGIKKTNPDLSDWAEQGVLLLNTALTVEENKPASHAEIWNKFTRFVIQRISQENIGLIFILWGNHAKKYKSLINTNVHDILEASHPSPLSANKGGFFECKHFSKVNELIKNKNGEEFIIKW